MKARRGLREAWSDPVVERYRVVGTLSVCLAEICFSSCSYRHTIHCSNAESMPRECRINCDSKCIVCGVIPDTPRDIGGTAAVQAHPTCSRTLADLPALRTSDNRQPQW